MGFWGVCGGFWRQFAPLAYCTLHRRVVVSICELPDKQGYGGQTAESVTPCVTSLKTTDVELGPWWCGSAYFVRTIVYMSRLASLWQGIADSCDLLRSSLPWYCGVDFILGRNDAFYAQPEFSLRTCSRKGPNVILLTTVLFKLLNVPRDANVMLRIIKSNFSDVRTRGPTTLMVYWTTCPIILSSLRIWGDKS